MRFAPFMLAVTADALIAGPLARHVCAPFDKPPRLRQLPSQQAAAWIDRVQASEEKNHFLRICQAVPTASIVAAEYEMTTHAFEANVANYFLVEFDERLGSATLWASLSNDLHCSSVITYAAEMSCYNALKERTRSYRRPGLSYGCFLDMRHLSFY